jgi:hypothetical protein
MPRLPKKIVIPLGLLLILVVIAVPSYYFYTRYQHSQALLANPSLAAKEEIKDTIAKVGRHLVLPAGEEPTLATVSDKEKLKGQTFFAAAENGDKVLIYTTAKKAVLYRPSIDKVIELAPVFVNENVAGASASAQLKPVKIAILNGTNTPNLTRTMEKTVTDSLGQAATVTVRGDTVTKEYGKTLVVDLNPDETGKDPARKNSVDQLTRAVKGELGGLPAGEVKPEADIVIIIGKNYTPGQ